MKLVCIVGRGGIGKTKLLSTACQEIENSSFSLTNIPKKMGADGILYILCPKNFQPDLEFIFGGVGELLKRNGDKNRKAELLEFLHSPEGNIRSNTIYLLSILKEGAYLLVFDGLEHLLDKDFNSQIRSFRNSLKSACQVITQCEFWQQARKR